MTQECVFFRREELSDLSIFYVAEIQTKSPATPSSSPGEGWEGVRCRLFASLQKLGHTRVCYHLHGYCGVSTVRHPCSVAQTVRNSTHYYLFTVTTVKLMQVSVCQCIYMCKETETERDRQRDTETQKHTHINTHREGQVLGKSDKLWVWKLNEVCMQIKVLFAQVYVNVVFVIRCLDSAVSLTLVKE